jgi:hypothetical protein
MRWYVSLRGQSSGPWEEPDVMRMVGEGQIDHVKGEAGGAWLPIPQSPFAGYARGPNFAPAPGRAPAKAASALSGAQWIFILGSLGLWIFSVLAGWAAVLVGIALIAYSVWRYREGKPSLMDIAWNQPRGVLKSAVTVSLGLLVTFCGATSVVAQRDAAKKRAAVAQASADAQVEKATQRKALENALPQRVSAWRSRLADIPPMANQQGPEAARLAAATVANEIETQGKILGEPTVPLLATVGREAGAIVTFHATWVDLLEQSRAAETYVADGKKALQKAQWLPADGAFAGAQAALGRLESANDELKKRLPPNVNVAPRRAEVDRLRLTIAPQVKSERKRLDREEAARKAKAEKEAAYLALCGEKPMVSAWDGEVVGLARVIKDGAHDPDSIVVDKCTVPVLTERNCWRVTCNVRGKNAFGGLILQRKTYSYSRLGFEEAG